jgi:hypothetical protein
MENYTIEVAGYNTLLLTMNISYRQKINKDITTLLCINKHHNHNCITYVIIVHYHNETTCTINIC